MDIEMTPCPWEDIAGFATHAEFLLFCEWINDTISDGKAKRIPVRSRYLGIESFTEEWFYHIASKTLWRLVHPDGPFRGIFERVDR